MGTMTLPTGEQQQILRLFLRGRDAAFIGDALGLPAELAQKTITELADDDEARAAELLAACDERGALVAAARGGTPRRSHPTPHSISRPSPNAVVESAPSAPAALPAVELAPPAPQAVPAVEESLLDRAASSDSARTRKLGEKVRELTTELQTRVEEEDAARQEAQAREQARLEAEQRVEKLATELAAATEELRELAGRKQRAATAASTTPERDYDPSVVRAWAKREGLECNGYGRVPQTVVAKWRASTEAVAS